MGESGAGSADSYIGSLISLTSKSEIRYEGLLYIVDTENSNIALQNVRSFGTEGRKKDGPQIPASDKVYDYIVFRGTDIKDLQVKSSPPAQQPNDPAIISLQSQRSQPAPVPPALIPPAAGPSTDASPSLYSGLPSSPFQMSLPSLYQPTGAGLGSWGLPPPPLGANGTGLLMPMYWSGLYRPLAGHASSQHHPFTPHPTPSLPPLPPRQLQAEKQPAIPSSLSTVVTLPSSFIPSKQLTVSGGSSAASLITPATFSAAMSAPEIVSVQASAVSVTVSSPPQVSVSTTFPSVMHHPSSVQGVSAVITPAAKTSRKPSPPVHSQPQIQSQIVGSAAAPMVSTTQSVPLTTVGSVSKLQSGAQSSKVASVPGKDSTLHMQSAKPGQVSAGILKTVSEPLIPAVHEAKQQQLPLLTQPLLPLPVSSTQHKSFIQGNGSLGISSYIRRGRGRGSGTGKAIKAAHPKQQFLEEFDFTAMNEKFKKDEVWGELGKGESREKGIDNAREGLANASVENDTLDKSLSIPEFPKKPVYVKDDFFDSLSCDALDREGVRSERMKHSEQRKIDTETFGVLPSRPRGGRGGRGGSRGGRGGYRSGFQVARNFSGGRANGPTRQGRGSARATSSVV